MPGCFVKTCAAAVLLATSVIFAGADPSSWSLVDMNRTIESTNFVVNRGCSGTLISVKDRYVLTANHCVADQYEFIEHEKVDDKGIVKKEKVRRLRDGTVTQLSFIGTESVVSMTYKVRLVAVDSNRDLALMQVLGPIPNKMASRLACADPVRGETVYIVGNPMSSLYSSVVKGIVSSIQRSYDMIRFPREGTESAKQPLMQISGGTIGGNSGGAVYNERGELIGVPVIGHRLVETVGFAVPLAEVKAFLKDNKIDEGLYACAEAGK